MFKVNYRDIALATIKIIFSKLRNRAQLPRGIVKISADI